MATLLRYAHKTGIALVITLGLIAVTTLVRPLLGDQLAQFLPDVDAVLADEPPGGH
ncbi:MAG: hypothetical protein HS114_24285 [Anaerolineales bacterium]|nr:hypothetical protein [Anaerolineales bacterium]